MNTNICSLKVVIAFVLLFFPIHSHSIDTVKFHRQQMSDKKVEHNLEVIKRALEITEKEFGSFKIETINVDMSVHRMLQATMNGKMINTVIVPASEQWDKSNIPIRVPVRLGLLSYRVLLVNKVDLPKFQQVTTLEELNNFKAGLINGWTTTKIFQHHKMQYLETGYFPGLFLMLNKHRFDYIPRGVYEVYDELDARKSILKDIVVEPTIALYIPTSAYVYISPTEPRLAKRMELGLQKLLSSGELKKLLYKYYEDEIKRSKLSDRKIFELENPYYHENDVNVFPLY